MSNQEMDQSEIQDTPSDRILFAMLEDFLCDHSPPDFKSNVIAKLANAGDAEGTQNHKDSEFALQAASGDMANGYGVVIPPPVSVLRSDEWELSRWVGRGFMIAATLAAAVAGAIFIPEVVNNWNPSSNKTSIAKETTETKVDPNREKLAAEKSDKELDTEPEKSLPRLNRPEVVPIESIATTLEKPKIQSNNTRPSRSSVNAMKDSDVVSVIDNQLNYLWKRVGITPTAEVQMEIWLDRTAVALLGRPATSAEKEAFRSNKSDNKIAYYVDGFLASEEFPRYWATRLAEHYLGKRMWASRELAPTERAYVDWLEESIAKKAFVGDIEQEMIAGVGEQVTGPKLRKDAASYWLAETMERSASVQRELVNSGSLVKKRDNHEESLIGVSRQLMRLSGNTSMVCSQCHLEESGSSDLRGFLGLSKVASSAGSNAFWRVPAKLSGMRLLQQESVRLIQLDSPKDYFYEDGEGRMALAKAGVPSFSKTSNNLETLAGWFNASTEPRRALVDLVWNQVFQQPLVPAIGLTEQEGLSERVDLRDLLASQIQLRNADLGTLVRWIVLSKATQLEGFKTDTLWYLKSTEIQIAATQRQMRMFAGYPRIESMQTDSGKLPMSRVAIWVDQKRSFQKDAMLAQGSSSPVANKGDKSPKIDYSEAQVRYLISVEEPYTQIHKISDKLAKSSMSWQMALEHAFLSTDARFPTRGERDEAAKLLEATGKDRTKALVMVMNARLGSW